MDKRIEHWDDERGAGNGIIVTLRRGWCFDVREHVHGFDTVREARLAVRHCMPCACPDCKAALES